MDINTYLDRYSKNGGDLDQFARAAGMSRIFLNQIRRGHKEAGLQTILGILKASDGDIAIGSINPRRFPMSKAGDGLIALIHKSSGLKRVKHTIKHKTKRETA